MALKDKIKIKLTDFDSAKGDLLKKAFSKKVKLDDGQTYADVTEDMINEKIADIIKAWVADVEKEEATINYTDMDA